jgi:hypothetical protein
MVKKGFKGWVLPTPGGKIEGIYRAPLKATRSSPFQETHIQDEYYWACIMHDLYGR